MNEAIIKYLDHMIKAYLETIEANNDFMQIHPRKQRAEKIEQNALLKAKVEALREVKMYIRLLEEEE